MNPGGLCNTWEIKLRGGRGGRAVLGPGRSWLLVPQDAAAHDHQCQAQRVPSQESLLTVGSAAESLTTTCYKAISISAQPPTHILWLFAHPQGCRAWALIVREKLF